MSKEMKDFPVHPTCHHWRKSVPWSLVEGHEEQAQRNHSQSLKRLAQRGGLGARELYAVIKDLPYSIPIVFTMSSEEAQNIIDGWIREGE